jgi:Laminin G domain
VIRFCTFIINSGRRFLAVRSVLSASTPAELLIEFTHSPRLLFFQQADFFAFEMLSGHVYLHLDLGSGTTRVQASPRRIDDGGWHEITLRRNGREGRVTVDGSAADFKTPGETRLKVAFRIFCLDMTVYAAMTEK